MPILFKTIPSHYRRLHYYEVIRKGDILYTGTSFIYVRIYVGTTVNSLIIFRRRHVTTEYIPPSTMEKHPVKKNPLVTFVYPHSHTGIPRMRLVRLIGANHRYFIGLDVNDKNRFKKFLRSKGSNFRLQEFNPESIS